MILNYQNIFQKKELRNDNLQNGNKNCLRILFPKFN